MRGEFYLLTFFYSCIVPTHVYTMYFLGLIVSTHIISSKIKLYRLKNKLVFIRIYKVISNPLGDESPSNWIVVFFVVMHMATNLT